ncbi:putative leucine-rich repeat-containing protein DDB_G0290503 [Mytilus californianus]|uniref:putative leucine-rich repeat-containing protein DDB_G0290503 n=1 Tax=Mytilus californianus TaxID=6549 RepID=UPI0022451829|nr:putative leucine-rich repeat-containing protein DDB_G0290503 [Mytilus californianus]
MSDLEVDSTSKSLVASWFGVNTFTETTENDLEEKNDIAVNSGKTSKKKGKKENDGDGKVAKSSKTKHVPFESSKNGLQVFTLGLPRKKTMSGFVGEKLKKKLTKLKHRQVNIEKEEKEKTILKDDSLEEKYQKRKTKKKMRSSNDEEPCSKIKMVENLKKKQTSMDIVYTTEALRKILNEKNNLTKNQKKNLKKKLHKFIMKEKIGKNGFKASSNMDAKTDKPLITEKGNKGKQLENDEKINKVRGIFEKRKNVLKPTDEEGSSADISNNINKRKKKVSIGSDENQSGTVPKKKMKKRKKILSDLNDTTVLDMSITAEIPEIQTPRKKLKHTKSCCEFSTDQTELKQNKHGLKRKCEKEIYSLTSDIEQIDDEKKVKSKDRINNELNSKASLSESLNTTDNTNEVYNLKLHRKRKKMKDQENNLQNGCEVRNDINNHGMVNNQDGEEIIRTTNNEYKDNSKHEKSKHKLTDITCSEKTTSQDEKYSIDKKGSYIIKEEEEYYIPKKRKKHKTRSKQKNIRKDHRPEHMKPAHLQMLKRDEDKQNN